MTQQNIDVGRAACDCLAALAGIDTMQTNLCDHPDARAAIELFAAAVRLDFRHRQTADLLRDQEPLGADFEAVWDANTATLYEPWGVDIGPASG